MLEGLEAVAWSQLNGAYGPASEVPGLLREIASYAGQPIAEERDEFYDSDLYYAWDQLINIVCHQGTVYEVSAYVVPYLVEMIQTETISFGSGFLYDLAHIANGSPVYTPGDSLMRTVVEKDGRNYDAAVDRAQEDVKKAHDAVRQHLTVYLDYLHHDDPEYRKAACFLLGGLSLDAGESMPILIARYAVETDEGVLLELLNALSNLMHANPTLKIDGYDALLEENIREEKPDRVRRVAAWALVASRGGNAPGEAVDLLASLLRDLHTYEDVFVDPDDIVNVLKNLGVARAIPIFLNVLETFTGDGFDLIQNVVRPLLDLTFGKPSVNRSGIAYGRDNDNQPIVTYWAYKDEERNIQVNPIDRLTALQCNVMQALTENKMVWQTHTNLYEMYGLPASREAQRALIRKFCD